MTGTLKSSGRSAVHESNRERQSLAEQVARGMYATDVVFASQRGEFATLLKAQQDRVAARVHALQVASCNKKKMVYIGNSRFFINFIEDFTRAPSI